MAAGGEGGARNLVKLAQFFSEPREITEVVKELREIHRKTGLERALAIGQIVLQRFFGGSPPVWHERRKNKNNSVRRIAEHPGCPLSRSALNEAISVYVAAQSLPCVQTSGHITASHIAAVTFLEVENQRAWLDRAERGRLSVRQLKEGIRLERHEAGERRGRPRVAAPRKLVAGVRNAVAALRRAADALSGIDLDAADTRELAALADQVAVLQADMRFHKGVSLSDRCAGPGMVVKVESDGALLTPGTATAPRQSTG
jgi:hypothetical protein